MFNEDNVAGLKAEVFECVDEEGVAVCDFDECAVVEEFFDFADEKRWFLEFVEFCLEAFEACLKELVFFVNARGLERFLAGVVAFGFANARENVHKRMFGGRS